METTTGIPPTHRDILAKDGYAHVATINADGSPQNTPVWYDGRDGIVRFSTVKGRRKHRNMVRDPRVAVSIVDPDDPYRRVEIRGRVTIEDDPTRSLIDELAWRYRGERPYRGHRPGQERVIVTVHPEHVTTMG